MLSVKAITNYNDFLKIKDSWDSLCEKSGMQSPYLTHDWFRIAYQHFHKQNDLFILLVQAGEEVIAIAPFILTLERFWGFPIKKLRFLENVHTPHQEFILSTHKSEVVDAILNFLQANTNLWDVFELREMRENSDTLVLLEEFCQRRHIYHPRFFISTSWAVSTDISLEEGLAKLRYSVMKKYKRRHRKLQNLGQLSFQVITDYQQVEENLHLFFTFYELSWKGREQNSDFYYKIAQSFCQRNEFLLFALSIDGKPISYVFALKSGRKIFGIKSTFHSSYYAYSPGSLLFDKIYEYCLLSKDIDLFDFGRGNESYKQDYGSFPVNHFSLLGAHKRTVVSYIFSLRYKLVLYLKKKKYINGIYEWGRNRIKKLKEIPSVFNAKFRKTFKRNKPVIYVKSIQGIERRPEENGWTVKYAEMGDMDQLVIASKAKRFTDVIKRLEKEKCLLINQNNKVKHYFWISDCKVKREPVHDKVYLLSEWDSSFTQMDKTSALRIFNLLCRELASKKCKELFIISAAKDSIKRALIESLGFKKYKGASSFFTLL